MEKTIFSIVLAGLLLTACSDSDSSADPGDNGPDSNADEVGETFSEEISSSGGGNVETDSGAAKVEIPGGALLVDTEISIGVEEKTGEAETEIYNMGPDGLSFLKEVTVSIKYSSDPPEGKTPVLAWKNGSQWEQVPGSSVKNGTVSGDVTHFSRFTVILVDDGVVVVSECRDTADGFSSCGGSLEGTWKLLDVCFKEVKVDVDEDLADSCADAAGTIEARWGGSITFTQDTVHYNFTSTSIEVNALIPLSCLEGSSCSEVPEEALTEDWSCSTIGSMCKCVFVTTLEMPTEPEPYSTEGGNLIAGEEDGQMTIPYCVQGNQVVVELDMEATEDETFEGWPILYWVLQKD